MFYIFLNNNNNNNNNNINVVPGRFRCKATAAFDFNFFELSTLVICTTEGEKNNNGKHSA